jgi:drug/metabolite transporter (DMT)-like permease
MIVAIALLASLAWGAADFLGGALSRRIPVVTVVAGSQVVGLVLLGVLAAVGQPALPGQAVVLAGVAAGACSYVGLTLMYRALAIGKMGVVAPIIGSSAAVPMIWGLLQGDRLTTSQVVGAVACLTGILAVTRGSRDADSPSASPEGVRSGAGPIALAVIAAVVFGASLVFLSGGSDESPLMTTVVMRAAACVVALPVVLLSRAQRHLDRRGFAPVLAIGMLDAGAYLAFSWASSAAQLSIVSVLSALYPVVTAVLAFFLHDERLTRAQLVGVALTVGGVVAIAL